MKRIVSWGLVVAAVGSVWAAGERTLSGDGLTLTFNVASGVIWTNTTPIESTVTKIVKEGAGDACLVPLENTTFTGEITIKAGFFSGLQKSFGKPSKLTVENGGALVFLDLMPGSIGGSASSPFWNTKFFIAGDGPDHYGAIQRPVTHCDHVINGLCKEMTLTADAMLNCGSRWGFAGTTLDMNNHTLTISAAKHTYPGSATKWSVTYSPIFQFARGGDLAIRNPGPIDVADGANILIESNCRVKDANASNGTVSNMVMTLRTGTHLRPFSIGSSYASHFKVRSEGTSGYMVHTTSYFDGPLEATGTQFNLKQYQGDYPKAFVRGGLTATNTTVSHGDSSHYTFTGSHTNEVRTFNQNGTGIVTLKDDNVFVMSNWWVGAGSGVSTPGRMIVRDNAQIVLRPGLARASTLDVGGRQNGEGHYGLLEVSGNAVVSNALAVGNYGRGALYQDGGRVHVMESVNVLNRGNNNAYFGMYGYGYVGINGGLFTQGYWFNLGGYDDGRGFIVQRGGVMEHWDSGDPVRMCFSGNRAYANIAQLGGLSTWKGYATMGFSNYSPTGYGSTSTITVSGTNTVMDMSANSCGIRMIASTNAHKKAWTGNVNLNDGGTLHAQHVYMTQMGGAAQGTPAWDSLDPAQVRAASKPYLNFNGGILKMAAGGEFFNSTAADHRRELERVTVYEKGAVIDTNGKNAIWRMPFLRPFGHGLKSATLPADVTANTATNLLLGPTRCYIASTNGGFAADLLMDFSNAVRRVTGVMVTCPGCGYEAAPVVTFEKATCNHQDVWTCAVETVNFDDPSFRHGGLTKRGAGMLTLTAENTYGGTTRCEGGTLAFTHANGLPAGGDLEFPAAALAAADTSTPLLQAFAYNGGTIRVTEAESLSGSVFGKLQTIARFTTPLTTPPPLVCVRSDGTTLAPASWMLRLSSDGRELQFGRGRGLLIAFYGYTADSSLATETSPDYFSFAELPFLLPQSGKAERTYEGATPVLLCTKTNAVSSFGVRFDRASRIIGSLAPKFPPHDSGTLVLRLTTSTPGVTGVRLEVADTRSNVVTIDASDPALATVGTHTVRIPIPHRLPVNAKGQENGVFALIGIKFLASGAPTGAHVTIDGIDFFYRVASRAESLAMEMDTGTEPHVLTPATAARGATVRLRNRTSRAGTFDLALRLTDFRGLDAGWSQTATATLAPDEAWSCTVPCPARYGVYTVSADVRVTDDATAEAATRSRAFAYLDLTGATPEKFPEGLAMGTVGHMDAYFGNETETVKMADAMAQIGLKILRIDFVAAETHRAWFDRIVEIFSDRGINFDFILSQPKANGQVDLNVQRDLWRAAFARYRGRVRYWELINEPDLPQSGNMIITPEEYHALAVQTKADLQAADPDAELMSAGFCTFTNEVRGAFQRDAMALCPDLFDLHCFHGHGGYAGYRKTIGKLLDLRAELGVTSPWYANETAITVTGSDERTQAETLYKKLLFAWSRGTRGYTWYNLRSKGMNEEEEGEHGYGMMTMDLDPRAVYGAWNNVTRLYGRKGFRTEVDLGSAYSCFVATNAAETVAGLWREQGGGAAVRVTTAAESLTQVDLFGNRQTLTSDDGAYILSVGNEPMNLLLPARADFTVEPVSATPHDFWDETSFELRHGGEDLNGDGYVQGREAHDALMAGDAKQLAATARVYGDPTGTTWRTESVADPTTGLRHAESVLHLAQRLTWTNDTQTAGVVRPNTIRWPSLLTTGKAGYSFFLRVRADAVAPLLSQSWIVNFGNEASGGVVCGLSGSNPASRTLAFWTMKQNVSTGIGLATDRWTDIAVSLSGDTLRWAVCQEGAACQTGSYTKAGFTYAPAAACTLGGEGYTGQAIAYNASASSVYLKCFRGSVNRFVVWERALSAAELQSAVTAGATEVIRLGAVNGHGFEFGESAATTDAFDVQRGCWRNLARDLLAGDACTLSFSASAAAAGSAQTLRVFVTPDSAAGTLAVAVNGQDLGSLALAPGASASVNVPVGTLTAGSNELTLTRSSGTGALRLDAIRLNR